MVMKSADATPPSPSYAELAEEKARLVAENAALKQQVAELEAALQEALAQLEAAHRAGKRQAAPF